jgi:ABC-type lipoprotein release transport system permease subunit
MPILAAMRLDCQASDLSVVLGCVTAAALTGTLRAYLFDVRAHDVLTFIMAPALPGMVAFMAVWIPACRASRVDPAQVLRGL